MPRKRLSEVSGGLRGDTGSVVELTSKPPTGSSENARRKDGSQAGFGPSAPSAKDTVSALVYELSQRLTAIVNSLGATRRLFAAGNQEDYRTAQQVVDEAAEQAHLATEIIRQFRQVSFGMAAMRASRRQPQDNRSQER